MEYYYQLFADVWGFLKKYYDRVPGNDDQALWDEVIKEHEVLIEKHNTRLAKALIIAVSDELQRLNKDGDKVAK